MDRTEKVQKVKDILAAHGVTGEKVDAAAASIVDAIASHEGDINADGFFLSDSLFCEWPDQYGTIRVYDQSDNQVERYDMPYNSRPNEGDHRWQELRDKMPDDALYFQPAGAGDAIEDCGGPINGKRGTSASAIRSYEVYRNRDNALKAHPDCEILTFRGADIEGPKFLDVPEPKLFFNQEE